MSGLTRSEKLELLELQEEKVRREAQRKLFTYFPDTGPVRRELYPKHTEFMAAGRDFPERAMMAGNRVGKTDVGCYETSCHLTGLYPEWWEGRVFKTAIRAWASGDTAQTVRDIIQEKLLGPHGHYGTGMIPGAMIERITMKRGLPDAVDTVTVRHKGGGRSVLTFKSYDQGREAFQGTAQHVVWFDEEPPQEIYVEGQMRTMTVDGIVLGTFTPLNGISRVVLSFLPGGKFTGEPGHGTKYVVMASWNDVPHLSERQKKALEESLPPHQREARIRGIPAIGSGVIYPVPESQYLVKPFEIPKHWPRVYGLDVGWNVTAALWGAWDLETDVVYLYSEYKRAEAEPAIHANAIRARGDWIPGVIDPAANTASQRDGQRLLEDYQAMGLDLQPANNAVEAGILAVWQRLSAGRLKVFSTLQEWLAEARLYRRDKKGKVVKENDHLMDVTRYLIVSGLSRAMVEPHVERFTGAGRRDTSFAGNWMT